MKFKSVDIVGFRAYALEGDGAFDFLNPDGKVSNFIAIYAPNGFGKSSFYDAMEWAITNNIGRYIRESQRTNNDAASLYLNNSESSQRILKNRYIAEDAPSYVKVRATGNKEFNRFVRRPALGQRDYTYDTARTDKTTKHLADIFLSQDAIDVFLKEERPEQRYDRFMGAFGGNDEKYRSSLFSSIKSCNRELKQLNDTISELEGSLREPTLDFSVDEVNKTIDEINLNGGRFPNIESGFSELEQTELMSLLSKHVIELNSKLTSLRQQGLTIDTCLGNLPILAQYRDHQTKLNANLEKILANRDDISSLSKAQDTKSNLEQQLREFINETQLISLILSNQQKLNKIIDSITTHKQELSALDILLKDRNVSSSAKAQSAESLHRERLDNATQLATLNDELTKVESQFVEIDTQNKVILVLDAKITECERRILTAQNLKKSLLEELSDYSNLKFGRSTISEVTQALLKPDPEFVVNYHQHLELKDEILNRINTIDENAKDLRGQSADLFSLISMAKSLLSKTTSDTCPVCNAQYESHTILLEKIQSNGSIEAALHSLLESKADLQKKIIQIDDILDHGQSYLTTLKSTVVASISERLSNTESEVERLNRELIYAKQERTVKTDSLHSLRAVARNLGKDDYVIFLNQAISSIKATIVKIDSSLEEVLASIKASKEAADTVASNRAEILAKLGAMEQDDIYILYKSLKTRVMTPTY